MSLEFVEQQQLLSKIYYRLIMIMMSLNLNQICQRRISLLVKFELNDKNNFVKKKMIMMSLSLNWICYKDKVSFIVKFGQNKNNFI